MSDAFVLHEGTFGRVAILALREDLVPHAHSDSHIVWWLGGSPAQTRVGKELVKYSVSCASACNAYEQHDLTVLDPTEPAILLAFYFRQEWLEKMSEIRGRPFVFPRAAIPIDSMLRSAACTFLDLMISNSLRQDVIEEAVEKLIQQTVAASRTAGRTPPALLLRSLLDFRVRRAITLMREAVDVRMTIDEVASRVGLSRARLFTLFRDQLNTTPQVLWSSIRLEQAIQVLTRQDESLADLAFDLGFSAPSNFSRFFKEHTGVSPSEYRRAAAASAHYDDEVWRAIG